MGVTCFLGGVAYSVAAFKILEKYVPSMPEAPASFGPLATFGYYASHPGTWLAYCVLMGCDITKWALICIEDRRWTEYDLRRLLVFSPILWLYAIGYPNWKRFFCGFCTELLCRGLEWYAPFRQYLFRRFPSTGRSELALWASRSLRQSFNHWLVYVAWAGSCLGSGPCGMMQAISK